MNNLNETILHSKSQQSLTNFQLISICSSKQTEHQTRPTRTHRHRTRQSGVTLEESVSASRRSHRVTSQKLHFHRKGAGEYFDILNFAVARGAVVVLKGGRVGSEESERWSQQPECNLVCSRYYKCRHGVASFVSCRPSWCRSGCCDYRLEVRPPQTLRHLPLHPPHPPQGRVQNVGVSV